MNKTWKLFKEYWFALLVIAALMGVIHKFNVLQDVTAATSKKVDKQDETFKQVQQIAIDLQDPSIQLRNWLINQGKDSAQAYYWSRLPRGPVPGAEGEFLSGIVFLRKKRLMDIGILQMYNEAGILETKDTLWNFMKDNGN